MENPEFEKRCRDLYKKYLQHCADDGILLPAPYPIFKQKVQEQMAYMIAHDLADKLTEKDQREALVICSSPRC